VRLVAWRAPVLAGMGVGDFNIYGAHTLKGDTTANRCGTIMAAIWTHRPTRGLTSSHFPASLPQLDQVCFSGSINGYNTVPLCSVLALFTYKKQPFSIADNFMTMIDIKNSEK
jgi:hypothetical protein